jgi:hypothetical protein
VHFFATVTARLEGRTDLHTTMVDSEEDALLRERAFNKGAGLDLSGFDLRLGDDQPPQAEEANTDEEADDAIGTVRSPFQAPSDAPEAQGDDPVLSLATDGERRLGHGLLVAMVVAYSALAAYVGTSLPSAIAAPGLLLLGLAGLVLGERWIPRPSMRLLGVTWVIISMKVLYGLALDVHHWGWLDGSGLGSGPTLGALLLLLIGLNVVLAQRHDDDAIAAQATLILLVVGSAAGGVYGEIGVVLMIGLGTAVLHGLALLRGTGNLASLGIAASYLWIGVHALSDGWTVLGLALVPFDDGFLTFLLMAWVTGLNAVMAARFARHDNWFSSGAAALGLGRPGLWAVSVGLGMVGAVLAVAAHREDLGYAMAQVTLLLTAFAGSYLSVRGVAWSRLGPVVLWTPLALTLALIPMVALDLSVGVPPYALHALGMATCAATAVLRHEAKVSDHVLWVGAVALVVLLSLLVPANGGEHTDAILSLSVVSVWGGLGALALRRDAPSLAGTAVVGPWAWALLFVGDADDRVLNVDLIAIDLEPAWLTAYLIGALLLTFTVNLRLGDVGVNLGRRFTGGTELSARMRDAGALDLWSFATVLAVVTLLVSATVEGLQAGIGLPLLLTPLLVEATAGALGGRRHRPSRTTSITGIGLLAYAWSRGHVGLIASGLVLAVLVVMVDGILRAPRANDDERSAMETDPSGHHALLLGLLMLLALVRWLRPDAVGDSPILTPAVDLTVVLVASGVALLPFLARPVLERPLLRSVSSALGLLVVLLLVTTQSESSTGTAAVVVMFLAFGAWMSAQAEVRAAMTSSDRVRARRLEQEAVAERRAAFKARSGQVDGAMLHLDGGGDGTSSLGVVDADRMRRQGGQLTPSSSVDDLGGIEHRPTVLLSFLVAMSLGTTAWSYGGGPHAVALLALALGAAAFIALARARADGVGLPLPQVAGVDLPVAVGLTGLVLTDVAGRMGAGLLLLDDQVHHLAFVVGVVLLGGLHVLGRRDLGVRLPSTADAVLISLVAARLLSLAAGGEVPVPFVTDPFAGPASSWTAPLVLTEAVLLALVLLHEWVEGERMRRGAQDARGAGGRVLTAVLVLCISLGPAALIGLFLAFRRGLHWRQPAVPLVAWTTLPLAWTSMAGWLGAWLGVDLPGLLPVALAAGAAAVLASAWVHWQGKPLWLAASLQAAHVLLVPAAWGAYGVVGLVVGLLVLSAASWVLGVLSLRRSWRVIGLADLLAAWVGFGMHLVGGGDASSVLTMLVATVAMLSVVTYLTQRDAAAMAED